MDTASLPPAYLAISEFAHESVQGRGNKCVTSRILQTKELVDCVPQAIL